MKLLSAINLQTKCAIILCCLVLILSACGEPPEPEVEVIRPVKMMTLGGTENGLRMEYPGVVAVIQSVTLGFEVPGKIIEFPIVEGQDIKKGDLLGRLDPVDYKAERDSAASHRRAMDAAYNRAKNIFDQNAGSQADVDNALRNIQVANEDLKKAQKALNDTYLNAPFSGQIAKTYVDNFQNVQAKAPIVLMHDLNTLKIEISVPEQDIAMSKAGLSHEELTEQMQPRVVISALTDKHFPAKVHSLATTADPTTRTFDASFRFSNTSDHYILPGMTAKLSILADRGSTHQQFIEIPTVAVVSDDQKHSSVWRVSPDTMQVTQVQVELGAISGENIRILNGLKQGDRIVISGVHHLHEGMKVYPLKELPSE